MTYHFTQTAFYILWQGKITSFHQIIRHVFRELDLDAFAGNCRPNDASGRNCRPKLLPIIDKLMLKNMLSIGNAAVRLMLEPYPREDALIWLTDSMVQFKYLDL